MDLAALDRRVAPEAAPDRLGERLRAVDDEQTRHRWIEAALDQVIDQRLHHGAVLGCPFHQPKRVLEPLAIDPERRHQHEMLTDVDAIDLHHHDVERGQVRTVASTWRRNSMQSVLAVTASVPELAAPAASIWSAVTVTGSADHTTLDV